ncbi:MAG: hypothetical protein D6702_04610 [Planctomycetota bacterium]|nr:MAG: hypothetical protein D6702_04610 [Planctomycetota bacterium]
MIAALLLALPAASLPPQEPAPAAREAAPRQDQRRRAFPRLSLSARKKAGGWLHDIRSGKKEETAAAARDGLIGLGAGVVPEALRAWARTGGKRLPYLVAVLDRVLSDRDLDLAWREVDARTAAGARIYLVRRVADSAREDAVEFLAARLAEAEAGGREAYEAARGLALRGDERALDPLLAALTGDWRHDRDRIRADFAGIERGPLSVAAAARVRAAQGREARLASLRLFGLVGAEPQLGAVKPLLGDPDHMVKLAAINACRALAGEEPVDEASVMEIIRLSREWEGRIR